VLAVAAVGLLLLAAGCGGKERGKAESTLRRSAGLDAGLLRALQATLDERRDIHQLPGMAAAVVIPGRGLWAGGSGFADRRTRRRATGRTPFAIGSVTKTFIAALVVKLAEEGRLGLDDRLSRWLPDYPNARQITLRQLLNHTSGLFGVDENPAYIRAVDGYPSGRWTPQRTLRYVRRPYFPPGGGWHYSDTNYVLLGLVIERAAGSTVATALHHRVLDRLGLRDIVLQPEERVRGEAARGYGDPGPDGRSRETSDNSGYVPYRSIASTEWTAAGIVASAESLARWGDALFTGRVVKPSSLKQMVAFVPANDIGYDGYGLGIGRHTPAGIGRPLWAVNGLSNGFGAVLWHLPSQRVTVAVLWNDTGQPVTDDIAEALLQTVLDHRG
jgi:D-alanyl-D-alanine carboxypeptidase